MAGPNGLHPRGALVLENAISVADRGKSVFSSIGTGVIGRRDRRQNETDDTLLKEWKKQWRPALSHGAGCGG